MRRYYAILGILTLLMVSCIEEFNAKLPEGESDILVVDGTIISDSLCTFYISSSNPLEGKNEFNGVDHALVKVVGSDGAEWQAVTGEPGVYTIPVGTLLPEVAYQLQIQTGAFTFSSAASKPVETPQIVDSISIKENKYEEDLTLYTTMRGSRDLYYRIIYQQDWEIRAEWIPQIEYDRKTGEFVPVSQLAIQGWKSDYSERPIIFPANKYEPGYSFPTKLYSIPLRTDHLSYRYCSTIIARAITQEEYEYEKIRATISENMGGLFTPQPSQLPSNITCSDPSVKAIGFVGVSSNVDYRHFYINTKEVNCLYNLSMNESCKPHTMDYFYPDNYNTVYDRGYRTVSVNPLTWAPASCVDVRTRGDDVSLEKPVWWQDM